MALKFNRIERFFENREKSKRYVDMYEVLTGNFYHKERGWIKVIVHPDVRKKYIVQMVDLLGGNSNTKAKITNNLLMGKTGTYLSRFHIERHKDDKDKRKWKYHMSFCAGQSYPEEIKEARKELSK